MLHRNQLIFEHSIDKPHDCSARRCSLSPPNAWREMLLKAGRDKNPFGSFARACTSNGGPSGYICPEHLIRLYDSALELDRDLRRTVPPLPAP